MAAARYRPTSRRLRDRPGRQLERTELAWERSTLGLVAAAALLLVRPVQPTSGRLSLAVVDLALAVLTAVLGRRRARRLRALRSRPGPPRSVPDASREVLLVSAGAVLAAAGTALFIAVQR